MCWFLNSFSVVYFFIIKSLLRHWGFSFVNLAAVRRLIFVVLFLALGVLHWMCRCLVTLFIPPYHNPNNICCIYILYLTHSPVQFSNSTQSIYFFRRFCLEPPLASAPSTPASPSLVWTDTTSRNLWMLCHSSGASCSDNKVPGL